MKMRMTRRQNVAPISTGSRDGLGKGRKRAGVRLDWKKPLALLILAALLLSGCSGSNGSENQGENTGNGSALEGENGAGQSGENFGTGNDESPAAAGSQDSVEAGGYTETKLSLPQEYEAGESGPYDAALLSDGTLAILDANLRLFVTSDMGESWEARENDLGVADSQDGYFADAKIGPDGSIALVWLHSREDDSAGNADEAENDGGENADKIESAGGENDSSQGAEGSNPDEDTGVQAGSNLCYHYFYVNPEGTSREIDLRRSGLSQYIYKLSGFSPDGSILGLTPQGKVYAVNPADASLEDLFTCNGAAGDGTVNGNSYYLTTSNGLEIYNFDTKEQLEGPESLSQVIRRYGEEIGGISGAEMLCVAVGEDKLYFAISGEGIFESDLTGESGLTQLADDADTSFGSENSSMRAFLSLPDGSFLAVFSEEGISVFSYDENKAARANVINVYSLYENDVIKSAANLYMKDHPDSDVRVEIGLNAADLESGKTAEDAIKNLNTKLMSGEGPDLLVLDGLPALSYEQKGILTDLSGLLGETGVFENIKAAYTRESGAVYQLPSRIELPMVFGRAEVVNRIGDLDTLAEEVRKLRENRPEGQVIANLIVTEEATMKLLAMVSQGGWVTQENHLDEAKVKDFLTAAKEIYDLQMQGYDVNILEEYRERMANNQTAPGEKDYMTDITTYCWPGAIKDPDMLSLGSIDNYGNGYCYMTSVAELDESLGLDKWDGQTKDCFIPRSTVGIASTAAHPEGAKAFFLYLFGDAVQISDAYRGLPVCESAMRTLIQQTQERAAETPDADGRPCLYYIGSSDPETDELLSLNVYPAGEEDADRLVEMLRSAKEPCAADEALTGIIFDAGARALAGEITIDEAVSAINQQAMIYLAE